MILVRQNGDSTSTMRSQEFPTWKTELHGVTVELRKNKAFVTELRAVRDQVMKVSASSNAKASNIELNGLTVELRNTKASVKQLKTARDMLMAASVTRVSERMSEK